MKLFFVKIKDFETLDIQSCFDKLTISEVNKITSFRFKVDQVRATCSVLLTKYFAQDIFSLKNYSLSKLEHGKPFFEGSSKTQFNISHSGRWVVGATSDNHIGIDVEEVSRIREVDNIAKKFFAADEYKLISALKSEDKIDLFYTLWTRKESFLKAIGTGLSLPASSFSVLPLEDNSTISHELATYYFKTISGFEDEDYKISVCSEDRNLESLKFCSAETIINYF